MSKLAALDDLLELYYQLNYHQNPDIFRRLQDVQAWQSNVCKLPIASLLQKSIMC